MLRCKSNKVILCTGTVENESSKNEYKNHLLANNFDCEILPVLDFEYFNLDNLKVELLNPDSYSGLVLTSPRAVSAITMLLNENESFSLESWQKLPIFCVGESTEKAVHTDLSLTNVYGTDCGNSRNLAGYIIDFFSESKIENPLLMPCSNIAIGTIPAMLSEKNIEVRKCIVYKTVVHKNLKESLQQVIKMKPKVMVFFSPSTVNFTINALGNAKPLDEIQVVALGPVTKEALSDVGIEADSEADKPDPASVTEAVRKLFN